MRARIDFHQNVVKRTSRAFLTTNIRRIDPCHVHINSLSHEGYIFQGHPLNGKLMERIPLYVPRPHAFIHTCTMETRKKGVKPYLDGSYNV
jgi:hypothetical protein